MDIFKAIQAGVYLIQPTLGDIQIWESLAFTYPFTRNTAKREIWIYPDNLLSVWQLL